MAASGGAQELRGDMAWTEQNLRSEGSECAETGVFTTWHVLCEWALIARSDANVRLCSKLQSKTTA